MDIGSTSLKLYFDWIEYITLGGLEGRRDGVWGGVFEEGGGCFAGGFLEAGLGGEGAGLEI